MPWGTFLFQYKSQKLAFALKNSFKHKLTLVKGEFQPSDPRFTFANLDASQNLQGGNKVDSSVVSGAVVFNPLATCWPRLYLLTLFAAILIENTFVPSRCLFVAGKSAVNFIKHACHELGTESQSRLYIFL